MGLEEVDLPDDRPTSRLGRAAARCWALLLTRIYECLPLQCPHCGTPMRIIAFVMDPPTIERILRHIDEPHEPPAVLPARSPPQGELSPAEPTTVGFADDGVFNQDAGADEWPDLDQTAGSKGDPWD